MVTIYAHKTNPKAVIPQVAYDSTSACFDITCIETTTIPAGGSAVVPNGLNLTIPDSEAYWMQIQLRSSKGFKYSLIPHYGTVDCVPAGTKISMADGSYKNIEDIFDSTDKMDKYILSYNEELTDLEVDEIEDAWIVKNQELILIETEDGNKVEIPLTKQVFTKRGWVYATDLTEDDFVLSLV
jgi:hypothetical protein